MLVKLIDHKGKERYINPIYIKSMTAKGQLETEIEISGWSSKVRVKQPVDEVALAVNAAMPDAAAYIAAQEDEKAAQDAATAATVVIG
ncbi:MAG: hypothetical protein RIB60_05630 [Phycisphaerales bacterium]